MKGIFDSLFNDMSFSEISSMINAKKQFSIHNWHKIVRKIESIKMVFLMYANMTLLLLF